MSARVLPAERVDAALVDAQLGRFTDLADDAISVGRSFELEGYLVLIDVDVIELLCNGADLPPTACVTLTCGRAALIYRPAS